MSSDTTAKITSEDYLKVMSWAEVLDTYLTRSVIETNTVASQRAMTQDKFEPDWYNAANEFGVAYDSVLHALSYVQQQKNSAQMLIDGVLLFNGPAHTTIRDILEHTISNDMSRQTSWSRVQSEDEKGLASLVYEKIPQTMKQRVLTPNPSQATLDFYIVDKDPAQVRVDAFMPREFVDSYEASLRQVEADCEQYLVEPFVRFVQ